MTTKQKVEFEQRMFDFIVTRDVAAAAINCMDVAEEMIQKELAIRDKKIDELKEGLQEILKAEWVYGTDTQAHAVNCVYRMKIIAKEALNPKT